MALDFESVVSDLLFSLVLVADISGVIKAMIGWYRINFDSFL